ncbi:hypothetical protein TVAG_352890 [Trichomonas vaginalis G3]|uniref:Uncharacterized protein n=1 Tax=Trichomonas vaginalis (strain ATCC PRA-98 / G3) TaxID=412133 RepID=A2EG91_TRIV3|nr:hypothetical protein TVAG_352890 [Trichomonas vaginalis G3]|eukprot:XP_001320590.1 hypothetical protein [Trichomonas vaginalis G3]
MLLTKIIPTYLIRIKVANNKEQITLKDLEQAKHDALYQQQFFKDECSNLRKGQTSPLSLFNLANERLWSGVFG